MNNLQEGQDFIRLYNDQINYFFIALGVGSKMYGLYANFTERVESVYTGKFMVVKKVQHLFHLSTDYQEAVKKSEQYTTGFKCYHSEKEHQNPYEFRSPEEISAEKRYMKVKGDLAWIRKMSYRWRNCKHRHNYVEIVRNMHHFPSTKAKSIKRDRLSRNKWASFVPTSGSLKRQDWKLCLIKEAKASTFTHNVGDKVELDLVCTKKTGYQSFYGYVNIINLTDKDGNIYVYKGKSEMWTSGRQPIKECQVVKVKCKIKCYNRYQPNYTKDRRHWENFAIKQNIIERPEVIKCEEQLDQKTFWAKNGIYIENYAN